MIQQRVIEAFSEERGRSGLPGYISTYDEFDHAAPTPTASTPTASTPTASPATVAEPAAAVPEDKAPAVEPAQVQGAEKPRGPHKTPEHQPQAKEPGEEGFGAGIFE